MAESRISARSAKRTDLAGTFAAESDIDFDEQVVGTVIADDFAGQSFDVTETEWFDDEGLSAQWRTGAQHRAWLQHERQFMAIAQTAHQRRVLRLGAFLLLAGLACLALYLLGR